MIGCALDNRVIEKVPENEVSRCFRTVMPYAVNYCRHRVSTKRKCSEVGETLMSYSGNGMGT